MLRVFILSTLIIAVFVWAKIILAIIVGSILGVLLIFTLKEAAHKGRRRLRYDDSLDPRYRDTAFYALWIGLTMHGGEAGAYDAHHPGSDIGYGGDLGGGDMGGGMGGDGGGSGGGF
jgi:hypothetical protein